MQIIVLFWYLKDGYIVVLEFMFKYLYMYI